MGHVFFFSYAHANKDKELERFLEDLCDDVKGYTKYSAKDPCLCFRDKNNIPLMEEWRPELLEAIQSSAVMVCATSEAYFNSRICGQEYYLFDQRRRRLQTERPAPVILPVVWVPDPEAPHEVLDQVQWAAGDMDQQYLAKGLRYLMKRDPNEYERCVTLFGEAIGSEWQARDKRDLPRLEDVASFSDIPNAFASGDWREAASPQGFLHGPRVANFIFAAGLSKHFPEPAGKYGTARSEWRPYFPPVADTVIALTKQVTKRQSLEFREIPIDDHLHFEMSNACKRKNLTLLIADAQALPHCKPVSIFDRESWLGTAVLMPWNDAGDTWKWHLPSVTGTFPIRAQSNAPPFKGPIATMSDFQRELEETLTDLRSAVTNASADERKKTDTSPTVLIGPGGNSL